MFHARSATFSSSALKLILNSAHTRAHHNHAQTYRQDFRIINYNIMKSRTKRPSKNKYLIDVREHDEVVHGMIPSAVNLPLSNLGNSLRYSPERFEKAYGFPKPQRNNEIIFYCTKGLRSKTASEIACSSGFTNILAYEGSWLEWERRELGKRY
ncbi:hypothetical protein PM082_014755 [Marasmius tenuissimus]|nr:hypothetical protein PM082_014755 [Marasmius tenuissimus]